MDRPRTGAAIDANAPLQDDFELANGPVDSEEERDAVMAAITRAQPQPLAKKTFILTRTKYQYVRMKEMLHNALGGSRGSGLFASARLNTEQQQQQQQQQYSHQEIVVDNGPGNTSNINTSSTNNNNVNHEFNFSTDRIGSADLNSPLNSAGLEHNVMNGSGSGGNDVPGGNSGSAGTGDNPAETHSRRTSSSGLRHESNVAEVRQIIPAQITQPVSRKTSASGIAVPG